MAANLDAVGAFVATNRVPRRLLVTESGLVWMLVSKLHAVSLPTGAVGVGVMAGMAHAATVPLTQT